LPYSPLAIIISGAVLFIVSYLVNTVFALVFDAPSNVESVYATVFFLAVIFPPAQSLSAIPFLVWVAIWAMASKYIFALHKKHLFNPAAFAVAIVALTLHKSANWWVSSVYLLPVVVVGGLLLVRKIRRFDLVLSFFAVATVSVLVNGMVNGVDPITMVQKVIIYSPILFFGFAMLTEPATTPPTRPLRIIYGACVGFSI
jgi:Na+-transporting NADH:ubiquinone oxidoreductase subunit NqrB